jgi:hypothetical protein
MVFGAFAGAAPAWAGPTFASSSGIRDVSSLLAGLISMGLVFEAAGFGAPAAG